MRIGAFVMSIGAAISEDVLAVDGLCLSSTRSCRRREWVATTGARPRGTKELPRPGR
ncbi:hypothetical protein GJR88_03943 [Dietzia sp. DQ12-45-1b]|nr:hypothetical protein GJR88_03943 [Dietzia sp. DQ12-45-1b]